MPKPATIEPKGQTGQGEQNRDSGPVLNLTIRSATVNEEARTVDATLATSNRVLVAEYVGYGMSRLIEEVLLPSGFLAPDGGQMPLLESHNRWSLDYLLGSIRNIRIEGEQIVGTLHFASSDEAKKRFTAVAEGHLRNVSVGYTVMERTDCARGEKTVVNGQEFAAGDKYPLRIVTKWKAREGSLVCIGADPAATVREDATSLENPMPGTAPASSAAAPSSSAAAPPAPLTETGERSAPPAGEPTPAPATEPTTPSTAGNITAERQRVSGILSLAQSDTPAELVQRCINEGLSVDHAARAILEHERSQRSAPVPQGGGAPAGIVRDSQRDLNAAVIATALLIRSGANPINPKASDAERKRQEDLANLADRYRGMTLIDVARECARLGGGNGGYNVDDNIRSAVSSGVLATVFTTSINARLMARWDQSTDGAGWVNEEDVADFKTNDRFAVEGGGGMKRLPRGGKAAHSNISDKAESYKVYRYAQQAVIDEQDIIDDNFNALSQWPDFLAEDAFRLKARLVYAALLANAALAADSVALFHAASHGNLGTGAGSALGVTAMETAIAAMMKQREGDKNLNIKPEFLIVPADLMFKAKQTLFSAGIITTQALASGGAEIGSSNPVVGEVGKIYATNDIGVAGVVDPITGTAYAGTAINWFLAASRRTVTIGYRAGTGRRPQIRTTPLMQGQWGINIDCVMDIGRCVEDYKGLYKADGQ